MPLLDLPLDIIVEIVHTYLRDFVVDDDFFSKRRRGRFYRALLSILRVNYALSIIVAEELLTYKRRIFMAISDSTYDLLSLDRYVCWSHKEGLEEDLNEVDTLALDLSGRYQIMEFSTCFNLRALLESSERLSQLWSEVVASRTASLSEFHFKAKISPFNKFRHFPPGTSMSLATPFLTKNNTRLLHPSSCQTLC